MEERPRAQLSSHFTLFYKFVFPTLWLGLMAGGTIASWLDSTPDGHARAILFAFLTMIVALVLSRLLVPLKRVLASDDGLIVSNYLKTIHVPYSEIESVVEYKWMSTRNTIIWLRTDSSFGQKIVFMPYTRFTFAFWRDHPAVTWLRERVAASKRPVD